jgi:hypothetical protein
MLAMIRMAPARRGDTRWLFAIVSERPRFVRVAVVAAGVAEGVLVPEGTVGVAMAVGQVGGGAELWLEVGRPVESLEGSAGFMASKSASQWSRLTRCLIAAIGPRYCPPPAQLGLRNSPRGTPSTLPSRMTTRPRSTVMTGQPRTVRPAKGVTLALEY